MLFHYNLATLRTYHLCLFSCVVYSRTSSVATIFALQIEVKIRKYFFEMSDSEDEIISTPNAFKYNIIESARKKSLPKFTEINSVFHKYRN